jgi:hypothetical protein
MASRDRLTAELRDRICTYIRAGADPNMAAEAAGVPAACFEDWLQRGQLPRPRAAYALLWREVEKARAQARVKAELAAYEENPLDWLRCGPGKETDARPGWTGTARPAYQGRTAVADFVRGPEFQALVLLLRRVLAPFPEALAALTRELGLEVRHWQDNRKSGDTNP